MSLQSTDCWGGGMPYRKFFMISKICLESVVYIVAKILGGREKNGLW